MHRPIYVKNNSAKFHSYTIYIDEPLGFSKETRPNNMKNNKKKNKNDKINTDLESVPDRKFRPIHI